MKVSFYRDYYMAMSHELPQNKDSPPKLPLKGEKSTHKLSKLLHNWYDQLL